MAKKPTKKTKKAAPKKAAGKSKPPPKKGKASSYKSAPKTLNKKALPPVKKAKASSNKPPVKASKPVKKPTVIKNKATKNIQKPIVPAKAVVSPPPVPTKVQPAQKAPAGPKSKIKVPIVLDPSIANLPRLPKGFHLKRQKGKLAPGEKRIVKTEVITHHVIHDIPLEELKKTKPEPKGKYSLEYVIRTPVSLLYDFLTTPNGLAEWFADGVDLKNDIYIFDWDGQKQSAEIVSAKLDSYLRLRWLDKPEGSYFEFRMSQDELTNEVSLIVTDFGDSEDDIATNRRLWASQIQRLIKALGTY